MNIILNNYISLNKTGLWYNICYDLIKVQVFILFCVPESGSGSGSDSEPERRMSGSNASGSGSESERERDDDEDEDDGQEAGKASMNKVCVNIQNKPKS